jgi:hypothetical protein
VSARRQRPGGVSAVDADAAFDALQGRLRPFQSPDLATRAESQTVLAIPSIDLDQAVLDRHADALPALEERCLYLACALRRPLVRLVVVTSMPVRDDVVDYHLGLIAAAADARSRLELLSPADPSPRPLAQKILERPALLGRLREVVAESASAFVMPFNVWELERDLALALEAPIYGIDHRFADYGTKTGSRRLFAGAGVAHPIGRGGLRSLADVADALRALRRERPALEAVVVKLDGAVYGEGNRILAVRDLPPPGTAEERAAIDVRLRTLPRWYVRQLADGGVVEELIPGEIQSPSVQLRILPGGEPVVLSTHDQVLGGELGQTFVACRFPADPAYAGACAAEARKVGEYLAARGVVGRLGVDFVVAHRAGGWAPYAVEINLREGGTSHPYGMLWLLTDGSLDEDVTTFRTPDGRAKHYFATDRLGRPDYRGIAPNELLAALAARGAGWDGRSQTGALFHMLGWLEAEGRIGVTAVGDSPEHAHEIYLETAAVLEELAAGREAAPA